MRTHLSPGVSFALSLACCLAGPLPRGSGGDSAPLFPPEANAGGGSATSRPAAASPGAAPAGPALPAAPDAAAQQKAARLIDDVYRKDLAAAKTPERQAALAEAMLKAALETKDDPAGQYVLLTKAHELAAGAGRLDLALGAAEEVGRRWDADPLKLRTDVLTKAAKGVHGAEPAAAYERAADGVINDAAAAGRFDLARRAADAALTVAKAGADPKLAKAAAARAKEVADAQEAYAKAEPAMAKLKEHPDDAAANLAVGKYLCFNRGNWGAGLPHLAAGNDPALAALAKKEASVDSAGTAGAAGTAGSSSNPGNAGGAANPAESEAQALLAVGDGWWTVAEAQAGLARRQIREHAVACYKEADPNLSGLAKAKAELRVKEFETQDAAAGGLAAGSGGGARGAGAAGTVGTAGGAAGATGGARRAGGVTLVNQTGAKEGQEVLGEVAARDPDLLKGVKQVELAKVHDGSEFKRHAGGPAEIPGAYSPQPVAGKSGGIMLWGIYEPWPAGKYLVVYRIQCAGKVSGNNVCFCDVCKAGNTIAQRRPSAADLNPPGWHDVAFPMNLSDQTTVEFRLWPNDHEIALDRVYVFRLAE